MVPALRVLLADPDAATRRALSLLLKSKMGLRDVDEAADGEAFAQALATRPPGLLLLDWSMPGRPNLAALLALQAAHPALHWVILSVDPASEAEAAALNAVFIHKGTAGEQVWEQLRDLVQTGA
jgi:DNA-binding NarL/FixJ family response regulator